MSEPLTTNVLLPESAAERARAIDDARARFDTSASSPTERQMPPRHHTIGRKILTATASLLLIGTGALVANRVAALVLDHDDHPAADTATTSSTTLTREQAAATYRDLVAPVNNAQTAFAREVDTWTNATSASDASADATPFAAALRDAHVELEQLGRDYNAAPDAFHRGVTAIAAVEADLARIVEVNVSITVDDWAQRYDADLAELNQAANALRTALGLPRTGTAVAAASVAVG